jgi:uncharacterized protein with HEPN domain
MRSESADAALAAIRENIALAQAFTAGLDRDAFAEDRKSVYAVVR